MIGAALLNVDELVQAAHQLDPLPASVSRLAMIVSSAGWRIEEVESVMAMDQAMTGRLLHLANSAYFGARKEIGTVREAVVRLGAGTVLAMAMAASVRGRMLVELPEYGLTEGALWRHSVAAAMAAEHLRTMTSGGVSPEAFSAALLHDIGKLVMARHLTPEALEWLGRARVEGSQSLAEAEIEILGVDHAELGGLVARSWRLPQSVVQGVQYHHDPDQEGAGMSDVTHVANAVAHRLEGESATATDVLVRPSVMERLRLRETDLRDLTTHVQSSLDRMLAQYEA